MSTADDLDEFTVLKPTPLMTLGGVSGIIAGATAFTTGLQMWVFIIFYSMLWVLPYLLMPVGLVQMFFGASLTRGNDWAAIGGALLTAALELAALVWLVYSVANGMLSPLVFLWAGLNGLALLLMPLCIPSTLTLSRARRKLYAS